MFKQETAKHKNGKYKYKDPEKGKGRFKGRRVPSDEGKHAYLKRARTMAWERLYRCAKLVTRAEARKMCNKIKERARRIIKNDGDAILRIDERSF